MNQVMISKSVDQLIGLLRSGQPIGGTHKDGSGFVTYTYEDGIFYVGISSVKTDITEEDLRARLTGHYNSLSEDEAMADIAKIDKMYQMMQANAVRAAEAMVMQEPTTLEQVFGAPEPVVILSQEQAYNLIHALDNSDAIDFMDGDAAEDTVNLLRYLYGALSAPMQKDIQELCIYEEFLEE